MEKIIMVDGNNLLFRSYYATAYNGNFMKNSKGFPTNALLGFTNMINKIINEEKPVHMIVAFDKGKTFRHVKYENYKGGRLDTPDELKMQFPLAKEMLTYMGIKYYEIDNYEADDIIGTFSQYCDVDTNYIGTIISSDKDLLQLISDDVDIKLLKQKDYIRYNKKSFTEEYKIDPINIIDLKALMGDPSDNIPGVKGIGEKTALKLLQEYKTIDNLYQNIDKIGGKVQEKLIQDKDSAYLSYELATIVKDINMEIDINDIKYLGPNISELNKLYEQLEFYSLLKKEIKPVKTEIIEANIIDNLDDINLTDDVAIFLEIEGTNYHNAHIYGMSIYNEQISGFIPFEVLQKNKDFFNKINKYTYDAKKTYVALKWQNIVLNNIISDTMLAASLLDYNIKDDIAYLAKQFDYDILFDENINKDNQLELASNSILKAKFIYETKTMFLDKLKDDKMNDLYNEIELPLCFVIGDMEYQGICVDKETLSDMGEEITIKLELLSKDIFNNAGVMFNISSPKELGVILFEKLNLEHGKKGKTGYSTAIDVLNKLKDTHPIINQIIEYRMLSKLYSTYIEGLINVIKDDHKIHTIYTQTLTRTGRLSSIEPNLQNIPIRYEYGKLIRKAFIPTKDHVILSSDYSQIELRLLAHMANIETLIEAFNSGKDIHTITASEVFQVPIIEVTSDMRRMAKAVNFGIIYGISNYGLSENIGISPKEAGLFIQHYFDAYPGIKTFMDKTIEKAHEDGYVVTLFGRKRNIPELQNKNYMIRSGGERMALNTPIQGTSADIIKKAMIDIDKKFKENNIQSKMILQVHDELVFDVLKTEFEVVSTIIKETMENVSNLKVPLNVELSSGNDWYQAK